jgi:hypothetical protein
MISPLKIEIANSPNKLKRCVTQWFYDGDQTLLSLHLKYNKQEDRKN